MFDTKYAAVKMCRLHTAELVLCPSQHFIGYFIEGLSNRLTRLLINLFLHPVQTCSPTTTTTTTTATSVFTYLQ